MSDILDMVQPGDTIYAKHWKNATRKLVGRVPTHPTCRSRSSMEEAGVIFRE